MQRRISRVAALMAAGFLTAALPGSVRATPARVNALDGGNFLVPDDWDISNYYHLGAYLKDHLYFYYPLDKKPYGWAMVDAHAAGVFTIWINRPAATSPIYQAAGGLGSFKYTNNALGAPGVNDWDPQETSVGVPDVKLSLGWGLKLSDTFAIGLCLQGATIDKSDKDTKPAGVASGVLGDADLITTYLNPGAVSTTSPSVGSYEQHQRSSSYIVGPSFGYKGESFTFDTTLNFILLGVDNSWTAALLSDTVTGMTAGTLANTLKSTAGPSYVIKARFMMPVNEKTTFAFDANVTHLDLSTEHRVKGDFSGAGTNYNDRDQAETLIAAPYVGMAGLVMHPNDDYLVVLGAGVSGSGITIEDSAYTPRNDVKKASDTKTVITNFNVPVVLGVEYAAREWLKLRAVGQRNFIGSTGVTSRTTTPSSNESSESSVNDIKDWILRLGVGLANERIGWDVLFNLAPDKADVRSPFFAGPTKITITSPSITTAVVYKW